MVELSLWASELFDLPRCSQRQSLFERGYAFLLIRADGGSVVRRACQTTLVHILNAHGKRVAKGVNAFGARARCGRDSGSGKEAGLGGLERWPGCLGGGGVGSEGRGGGGDDGGGGGGGGRVDKASGGSSDGGLWCGCCRRLSRHRCLSFLKERLPASSSRGLIPLTAPAGGREEAQALLAAKVLVRVQRPKGRRRLVDRTRLEPEESAQRLCLGEGVAWRGWGC